MLAHDVARFVGEPFAIVVAETPHLAEEAAEQIIIDFEGLPVVASVDAALAEAPRLHEHPTNVLYEANVDEAFATSEVVIERTFVSPRQSAFPLQTRGVLAEPTEAGLYVHASTQVPHLI
jgi:carbon-monoxide dehydrogenase large subunit